MLCCSLHSMPPPPQVSNAAVGTLRAHLFCLICWGWKKAGKEWCIWEKANELDTSDCIPLTAWSFAFLRRCVADVAGSHPDRQLGEVPKSCLPMDAKCGWTTGIQVIRAERIGAARQACHGPHSPECLPETQGLALLEMPSRLLPATVTAGLLLLTGNQKGRAGLAPWCRVHCRAVADCRITRK